MKTLLKLFFAGLIAISARQSVQALEAGVSVGVQIRATTDFYTPLSSLGVWVDVGNYGRCWHPRAVEARWRPYCTGQWVWTDLGWYWQSDEPWSWACYHYGSWMEDSEYGWVWVPDIEWAPAWVYWRVGGEHIGWAPCAPRGRSVEPSAFAFVTINNFGSPIRPSAVIVNNTTIINQTQETSRPRRESRIIGGSSQSVMINEGPGVEAIQKATGRSIKPVPIQTVAREMPAPTASRPVVKEPAGADRPPRAPEQQPNPRPDRIPERQAPPPVPPRDIPERRAEPTPPPSHRVTPEERAPAPREKAAPPVRPNEVAPPAPGRGRPEGPGREQAPEKSRGPEKDKDKDKDRDAL